MISPSTIKSLIARHGKPLTVRRVVEGAYNPATSTQAETVTDTATRGCIVDTKTRLAEGAGNRIFDKTAVLDATVADITAGDQIVDGARAYTALDVVRCEDAGVLLGWIVLVK